MQPTLLFVHLDGRLALCVSQFTQFRTPNFASVFRKLPFRSFAFRRLLSGGGGGSQQRGRRWGRCSIYRHRTFTVGLKIEIHEIHQNLRNPVTILSKFHPLQQNPLTVGNIKRKLSKSNVSSYEINGFHEIQ